jgi:hypothetical protein
MSHPTKRTHTLSPEPVDLEATLSWLDSVARTNADMGRDDIVNCAIAAGKTIRRLREERDAAVELLTIVAEFSGKFSGSVVEICAPHPDNPSPRIEPFPTERFQRAASLVARLTGEQP